jgi:hypothetical protein
VKVYLFLFILWQYHGSFSLRHWLQQLDRLPTLEANLALDEESVRRVGDDTIGGPAVSRQLQITHIDEGSLDWSMYILIVLLYYLCTNSCHLLCTTTV